ncbi:MAG: DUF4239 domain-containing protein [Candidatus Eremiobacteraeota bacterium]|nr:DUF4239 domain-containing protein [Candidatus Eremiobacteraeota bacterium]
MIAWLEQLPTLLTGIVVVGGFMASTLAVGYCVATFTSREVRNAHNDRAGFILAVIGVIYAVLLAFVAIGVWERFQRAEERSYEEAASLATIYRDAASFPNPQALRQSIRSYIQEVISDEWPQMRRGERSEFSGRYLERADRQIRALRVNSPGLQDIQNQMLAAADTALMDREIRLTIDFIGISGLLWVVLVAGAYITVGFTYLFGFDRTIMQQLMIGALSLMIGLVVFLTMALDYPYRGSIAVEPEAFRALLESLPTIGS